MTTLQDASTGLDAKSFKTIADLAYRESGLTLVAEKSSMVQSRLRHRLRDLGLASFSAYCDLIQSDAGRVERGHLISALTTNVSHFFRERHHFETLSNELDRLLPRLRMGGAMRIWSAGCSNGQEALSAAVTMLEHTPTIHEMDLLILATDIDPQVVQFARHGVYPERLMGGVPAHLRAKYFRQNGAGDDTTYEAVPAVRDMVRYNQLNLLGDWPMSRAFDVIFCRNVVIYFDVATQEKLWPRFRQALDPVGVMFLGHSERIIEPPKYGLTCTGPNTYRPQVS